MPTARSTFEKITAAGGDTGLPLNLKKRLDILLGYSLAPSTRFLDCGCGTGQYVFELVERADFDAFGIEFQDRKVDIGRAHPRHGHRISQGDLQCIDSPSESWDAALLNEVIEHLPDEETALGEIHRVIKKGGLFFVFAPNRWYPFETHGVYLKKSGARVAPWVPGIPYIPLWIGTRFFNYWARNYWQSELQTLLENAGFQVIERKYIWQTFEGISKSQPRIIKTFRPFFRTMSAVLGSVPLLRRFGISQVLICRK